MYINGEWIKNDKTLDALGVRVLFEQVGDGENQTDEELTEKQKRLKAEFIEQMGYWSAFRDKMLTVNEDFFEAYLRLITHPWKKGVLEPKVKGAKSERIDLYCNRFFCNPSI